MKSDKRTKEVFVLSLERMTSRAGQGFGAVMDWMDGGVSEESMTNRSLLSFW
jgi:hypothetical protein